MGEVEGEGDRELDFHPTIGMRWEVTQSTADTSGELLEAWRSEAPLTPTEVLEVLGMGCHSTDITDALDAADSGGESHDADVERRRAQGA